METTDEWHYSELVLGIALFNIFVSVMGSGIKCILSKFAADTTVGGAVTKGRDGGIQRGMDRLER